MRGASHADSDWWCADFDALTAAEGAANPRRPPTSDWQTRGATNADTRLYPTAPLRPLPGRGGTPFCAPWAGSDRGLGRARGVVYPPANTAGAVPATAARAGHSNHADLSLAGR